MRHLFTTILIILGTAWGAGAQLVPASGDIPVNDPGLKYGIQTAIEVRKELSRDLELNAGVEARFRGDFFYDKQLRFFAGAEYKLAKRISVEGAYTIKEVAMGPDSLYYAQPVKVYGQGEIVPAATPVLYKCVSPYASGNKVVPVGEIARHTDLPISSNLLMGSYFSSFTNYADLSDYTVKTVYIPEQAIPATPEYLALAADSCGKMTFVPKDAETYMDANSAWLNIQGLELDPETEIIFGMMPVVEPVVVPDPEPKDGSGDANGDTKVDVDDLTLVISFVLGDSGLETKSKTVYVNACDVDMNGNVDVDDVTALIQLLLNSHDDSDNGSVVE